MYGRSSDLVDSFHIISQPKLHNWGNKGRGMYCPVYEVVHIKYPLLLNGKGKSRPCSGGTGFPLLLLSASLNNMSFLSKN